jgi:hypothetical protein
MSHDIASKLNPVREYANCISDVTDGYVNVGVKDVEALASNLKTQLGDELTTAYLTDMSEYIEWAEFLLGDSYESTDIFSLKMEGGGVAKLYSAAVFSSGEDNYPYTVKFGKGSADFKLSDGKIVFADGREVSGSFASTSAESGGTEYARINLEVDDDDMGFIEIPCLNKQGANPNVGVVKQKIRKGESLAEFLRPVGSGGLLFMRDLAEGQRVNLLGIKASPEAFTYTQHFVVSDIGDIVPNSRLANAIEDKLAAVYRIKKDASLTEAYELASKFFTNACLTVTERRETAKGVYVNYKIGLPAPAAASPKPASANPETEPANDKPVNDNPTEGIPF